ncbi:hypothetical protein H0H81_005182 [Sphagnurus paluster]|uniref:Uncharacterized protein n=1 Tax=Sphagnurus paluster TaxID=117069 RepID=A0A9P7GLU5_9AGAR|nr:hypothetical protein H0H81_005182 [Sphagnurus paluster]
MASTASSPGVALITGAAKGIGRAIALRLAKNGYDVGMNDLPTAAEALEALGQEIASLGRRSYIAIGDVSVPDSVENIVSSVVENLGHLDVPSPWNGRNFFAINARSVFLCYKYAAQQMIKQGTGGRIIGAASIAGKKGVRGLGAYSATKFAVCGLTQVAGQCH